MSDVSDQQLIINGWKINTHPLVDDAYEALQRQVGRARKREPNDYQHRNAATRLAAITKLVSEVIPGDPSRPEYRLGATLGDQYKHWFRAKFFQQYRLFFRYSSD